MLEEEARKRQLATLKQNTVRELIPEREAEAKERQREHAGTAPGVQKTLLEKIPEVNANMEQITILTGSITTGNSGQTLDTTREVCFDGELVGTYKEPGMHKGSPTDTRGTVQALYRTEDGAIDRPR